MLARVVLGIAVIALLGLLFAAIKFTISRSEIIKMAGSFLFLPEGAVESTNSRTNILLLGKAGKEPTLTDTIMLISISRKEKDVTVISIPRDIWIPEFTDKINSAYWRGQEKESGGGLVLSKSVAEDVLGVTIHYAAAFDFEGFAQVIDILGGVEVQVERSFTDEKFPIPGRENDECGGLPRDEVLRGDPEFSCRYETIHFEKGRQLMDGETALKFARSRQSEDPDEGNDLARAARQQKVLLAIKDKLASRDILFSPKTLSSLWFVFWKVTETDMTKPQLAYIGRLVANSGKVSSHTIPLELLENPPYSDEYNNLYVFIPKAGEWSEVHRWLEDIF
ncbi:hypothetical protein A2803_05445 [Candidatus Woesebacteria bacterium RIFCSPHIGHO2_01_FULL_44_21]|uniref:Cell envelope-related transcriptional attenuator domain-containing protein n=1 Tax=Candidatus Woesebacteria bacterium RIFCSPHIGHO2_01_FULL_44_21 TaxID=1802503 RepID=A0A1F7YXF1_9BACT|nr:MAG: hypothetical protein A2803_05445 [Candidatus Woesebacteria bacterium RIFCSPHIGHO2_01_FULL_44_21]OGM68789.1 MAG: hypothetical protein A2897_01300 [Candidatus Woesebacteria bacterium RIFCSPLOWO2_01_FULL_44_24b]